MTRTIFNDGWQFRPKVTAFQELGGTSGARLDGRDTPARRPDRHAPPRGCATRRDQRLLPRRCLRVPQDASRSAARPRGGSRMLLEFDGVYRDAVVYVNGDLAGQRAFGYSRFSCGSTRT